jgi:predicted enzyme related to lactoylglutathione lyase
MSDPQTDPLEALLTQVTPLAPDPTFAANLRIRLLRALPAPTQEEPRMINDQTTRPRNGVHPGDVSYVTLGVPDLARGRAFYAAVLDWQFSPGSSDHGAQVDDIVPMTGLWDGEQPTGGRVHGAVLGFRVADIAAAVAAVRANGGTIDEPHREPYALVAEGHDNQGIPFYLHEMPDVDGVAPENGDVAGDISYLTMVVPDLDAARSFYTSLLGWTFNIGGAGSAQVTGVTPQIGMTTQPEGGPATPGVILCYRVDDIAGAVERVRAAGGGAGDVAARPYGLESQCTDDQGTPFYLHQF